MSGGQVCMCASFMMYYVMLNECTFLGRSSKRSQGG